MMRADMKRKLKDLNSEQKKIEDNEPSLDNGDSQEEESTDKSPNKTYDNQIELADDETVQNVMLLSR